MRKPDILKELCSMEADMDSIEKLADLFPQRRKRKISDTTGRYISNEEFEEIMDIINRKILESQK